MLSCPFCKRRTAYLLFTLEDKLHIVVESGFLYHIFKCLEMHEELSLVIVRTPAVDGTISDLRLERIGFPEFERIDRLYIIMSVDEYGRKRRVDCLLCEYDRMALCRKDLGAVGSGFKKELGEPLRTTEHVILMRLQRAHRRNPYEREKLLQEPVPVLFNIFFHMIMVLSLSVLLCGCPGNIVCRT